MNETNETRIVLLGGRMFPSLMNIFTDIGNIIEIISLSTPERKTAIDNFMDVLPEDLKSKVKKVENLEVHSDDFDAAKTAISKVIKESKGPIISIDITACPKIPALAAWEVARENNLTVIYTSVNSSKISKFIFQKGNYRHDSKYWRNFTVDDYVSLYGRTIQENFDVKCLEINEPKEDNAYKICQYLVSQKESGIQFLKLFRCISTKQANNNFIHIDTNEKSKCKDNLLKEKEIDKYREVFNFLEENNVITNLNFNLPQRVVFDICTHNQSFLNGRWLDYYVYRILKDSGFFYDCRYSVKIPVGEAVNELDFIGVAKGNQVNNRLYIVEAKTGKVTSKDLDTLNTAADLIGGKAVVKFFIYNEFTKNIDEHKKQSLEAQAKQREIHLIFADDLEANKLIEKIKNLKYKPI